MTREERREYNQRYYLEHAKELREKAKERVRNLPPEVNRARCAEYRTKHGYKKRAHAREYYRKSYAENPDIWLERNKRWRKKNGTRKSYVRHRIPTAIVRELVEERAPFTCTYCDEPLEKWEIDHIIPLSKGGDDTKDNLCICCPTCNRSKRDKDVAMFLEEVCV